MQLPDDIQDDPLVRALLAQYSSARIVSIKRNVEFDLSSSGQIAKANDTQIARYSPSYVLLRELQRQPGRMESLSWRQFEKLIADLLERDGYTVELMRGSKDGGVDVVASKNLGMHGLFKSLWQAKHIGRTRRVGLSVVKELADTRNEFQATKAIVVTSSYLTRGALQRIERDKYWLGKVDRKDLDAWITRLLLQES